MIAHADSGSILHIYRGVFVTELGKIGAFVPDYCYYF